MDNLRLILLLFGAGVILAVYAWTRFQNRPRKTTAGSSDPAFRPHETDEPDAEAIEQELAHMEQVMSGREPESSTSQPDRLLIISVVAPQADVFSGDALYRGLQNNKLQFDERGIYQRVTVVAGQQEVVFGVANLVKPGVFPATDMRGFSTPGITLFLQLPGPLDPVETFDDFVYTAERLAVELGGELQDQKQCVITHQSLMQIREGIVEDQFLRRAAS